MPRTLAGQKRRNLTGAPSLGRRTVASSGGAAASPPALRNSYPSFGTAGTGSLPTGWAAGDDHFIFAVYALTSGGSGSSAPSGWTKKAFAAGSNYSFACLHRKLQGGDSFPAVDTFAGWLVGGFSLCVSGAASSSQFDQQGGNDVAQNTTNGLTFPAASGGSITTAAANDLCLEVAIRHQANVNFTLNTANGWALGTEVDVSNGNGSTTLVAAWIAQTAAGSVTMPVWAGSGAYNSFVRIALKV